jgi:cobyrinic acid a,c-diamide synthase
MKRVMIAGTSSWAGKTTICAGIMAALTRKGRKVVPFKVGPDYIDPGFHRFVTGNPSYNLDSWLLSENTLRHLFLRNAVEGDISIIEGVMGLYDGLGSEKDMGSSAHVSKILKIPVILVIDGKGISSSAAAQVLGYTLYDREVSILGVIMNRVSGDSHYRLLKESIERDTGIPCLGYLPINPDITLGSRHLGLIPIDEVPHLRKKMDTLADMIDAHIDLDALEHSASLAPVLEPAQDPLADLKGTARGLKVGIARDEAFTFYYEDNLKLLAETGMELIPFSPLMDRDLPADLDGLYIGGGFPEIFADSLERNEEFRFSLKDRLDEGMPLYGECGGLMYLTGGIERLDHISHDMVGFFPTRTVMTAKLQRFGYIELLLDGKVLTRGHEFHHSHIVHGPDLTYRYKVKKIRNGGVLAEWDCGLARKNAVAGYAHVHFYSSPDFLGRLIHQFRERK